LKKAGFEVCISDLLERYAVPQDIKPDLIWWIILSGGIGNWGGDEGGGVSGVFVIGVKIENANPAVQPDFPL